MKLATVMLSYRGALQQFTILAERRDEFGADFAPPRRQRKKLSAARSERLRLWCGGELCGELWLLEPAHARGGEWEITWFRVQRKFRRAHLASLLCQAALRRAQQRGCTRIQACVPCRCRRAVCALLSCEGMHLVALDRGRYILTAERAERWLYSERCLVPLRRRAVALKFSQCSIGLLTRRTRKSIQIVFFKRNIQ